jgi:2-hydroxy-3-oxopropionate reductase
MEILQALRADGRQKEDHGGIIQFYEKLAHVQVRAEPKA